MGRDEAQVRGHVDKIVRESVEQALNGLLEAEAKQLCSAGKYERTDARRDTRWYMDMQRLYDLEHQRRQQQQDRIGVAV